MHSKVNLPKTLPAFVWHFLRSYRSVVIIYVCLAIFAGFWGPFNTLLIKYIVNSSVASAPGSITFLFWPAVLLVLNFMVFDNVTWRGIGFLNYKYQPVIKNNIISQTFEAVLSRSHNFFQNKLSGRISSHINMLADNIERILHNITADFIRGSSLLLVALVSMYFVNPKFSLILALWFLVFSSFSVYKSKRLVNLSDIHAASESVTAGQLVDSISNVTNVRMFASNTHEISRLENFLLITKKTFQSKEIFLFFLHCVQGGLIAIMLAAMLYLLIQLFASRSISVGDFVLIMGLSMEVGHMSWYTMGQVDEFNLAVGKCRQSLNALFVPDEITDKANAKPIQVTKGKIEFNDVTFYYYQGENIFANKNVVINPGEKIGLVGFSGAGKSTFVNLMMRYFEVESGSITIDGQNIAEVTQVSLRENISMIPQDTSLFHRSLMENIRYGRLDATDEEVMNASKRAHAHEFIERLPEGYQSLVGERGIKLSGGQRQRIAIARAMLKDAPILILDEATSALDSVTEKHIQAGLHELMAGRTTVVIAHRLSTLAEMDRILVIDQGHIIEDGTHKELLKKKGHYAKMWNMQAGGFLPDIPVEIKNE